MSKRGQPGQKQGEEGRDYWGVREDIEVKIGGEWKERHEKPRSDGKRKGKGLRMRAYMKEKAMKRTK